MMQKRILTLLIVLTLIFIWGNSLLSREVSGAISDAVMEKMNAAASWLGLGDDFFTVMRDVDGDGIDEPSSHLVRKAAHVTEFAVLAALLWLRIERKGVQRSGSVFLLGVITGAADETIQIFSYRGSMVRDVFIDAAGVLLGLSIVNIGAMLRAKKRKDRGD